MVILKPSLKLKIKKNGYNFLVPKIINKDPITSDLIKKIHYQLMQGVYDDTVGKKVNVLDIIKYMIM